MEAAGIRCSRRLEKVLSYEEYELATVADLTLAKNEAHSIFPERVQHSCHHKLWIKFSHTSIHEFFKTSIPFSPSEAFASSHSSSPPATRPANTKTMKTSIYLAALTGLASMTSATALNIVTKTTMATEVQRSTVVPMIISLVYEYLMVC